MNLHYECEECGAIRTIPEEDIKKFPHCYIVCDDCGTQMKVKNVSETVKLDIEKRIEEYVHEWFNMLGIEYTIELIERHQNTAVGRLYMAELKRRGLIK